jgi:putative esterase
MSDSTISVRRVSVLTAALAATAGALAAVAQVKTNVPDVVAGARPAIVERITIHGQALEGNLEADAVDREAFVFLPPGYHQNRTRRYPVVYALHGYSIGAEQWTHEIHVPQTIEGAFARGAREMIVVLPDSKTVHNGSMYSSSVSRSTSCRSSAGRCRSRARSDDAARSRRRGDPARAGARSRRRAADAAVL